MDRLRFNYDALNHPRAPIDPLNYNQAPESFRLYQAVILPIAIGLVMTVVGFLACVVALFIIEATFFSENSLLESSAELWLAGGCILSGIVTGVASYNITKKMALKAADKADGDLVKIKYFAYENDMIVDNDPLVDPDFQPGMLFRQGRSHNLIVRLRSRSGFDFQIANGACLLKSANNKSFPYNYAFVRLALPRKVPHIVLDSPKNNLLSAVGWLARTAYSSDRQLKLEGNFNERFRLYVPEGYERDALYIFTPDIMQMLMEMVNDYDIELVDDSLYIWRPGKFDFTDRQELMNIESIINRILPKFERRTDYYSDQRTGEDRTANRVAAVGQRIDRRP